MASLSDGGSWVLHVREKEVIGRGGGVFVIEPDTEAQSVVEHAAQELDDAGIKTHYEVRNTTYGRPWRPERQRECCLFQDRAGGEMQ